MGSYHYNEVGNEIEVFVRTAVSPQQSGRFTVIRDKEVKKMTKDLKQEKEADISGLSNY